MNLRPIFKISTLSLIIILAYQCSPNKDQSFIVEYRGALKNIMHKGDLSAKTNLLEYQDIKNLYALGAIENLKGEIQIFNSQPLISYVSGNEIKFDSSFSKNVTLFVSSVVKKWQTIPIPSKVVSKKELEKFIEKSAVRNDIDTDRPFPFLIGGFADELSWHVINWKDGDNVHSHEKHIASGLNGILKDQEVNMLGFYSNSHHAIFTHHTTNMHIHFKLADGSIAGHLDDFKLGKEMFLKLPVNY